MRGLLLALVACGGGSSGDSASSIPVTGSTGPAAVCADGLAAVRGTESFTTVSEALSTASAGDEVRICAGTWPVEGAVSTGQVSIIGDTGNPAGVVLEPSGGEGTILRFLSSTSVHIQALTLRGATTSAIVVPGVAELTIDDCIFVDNAGDVGGGALAAQISSDPDILRNLRITDSTFRNNTAPQGGALELVTPDDAQLWIEDSVFEGNTATGGVGGAVSMLPIAGLASGLFVERCTFTNNDASADGGAVAVTGPGEVRWTDTDAIGNTAANAGAAYAMLPPFSNDGSTARIEGGRIAQNVAQGVLSGAVHLEMGWTLTVENADFATYPEDNVPKDVNVCADDYDGVVSFSVGAGGCQ